MSATLVPLQPINGSSTASAANKNAQGHSRTYQACIPCRRRKVRCDLGPVDNPHDPPCARCKRESKECYFSATRRKRRTEDGLEVDIGELSDYEARNGRKKPKVDGDTVERRRDTLYGSHEDSRDSGSPLQRPLTPGGSAGRYQPLRRPNFAQSPAQMEEDQKLSNATTAILQTSEVYGGHDALNLLFEAAGRNGDIVHHRTGSTGSAHRSSAVGGETPSLRPSVTSPHSSGYKAPGPYIPLSQPAAARPEPMIDPAITRSTTAAAENVPSDEADLHNAIKAWSRLRFVRAGWFTAKEAIAYIDYFYAYLSPLTPIVIPDYRHPSTHPRLLQEEPILLVTLLTIASRYMKVSGAGATSRSYSIHAKLWSFLQGMIDRMTWGQEQVGGGGFVGAGALPAADISYAPKNPGGLRTLGTVESLLILTEWHPRALHFPPGDDNDELMVPEEVVPVYGGDFGTGAPETQRGIGGRRIDSWLEPCWRSDRMCWMLLGMAMSLAFELGVFDDVELKVRHEGPSMSPEQTRRLERRKETIKELLMIYVTQTSGRLGLTSMLPPKHSDVYFSDSPRPGFQDRHPTLTRARVSLADSIHNQGTLQRLQEIATTQDTVLYFWMKITEIMRIGNQRVWPSRDHTKEIIKTNKYIDVLEYFAPLLKSWKSDFDKAVTIPVHMRHILSIEYEYCRVYLNSVALQAVVERCTNNTPGSRPVQPSYGPGAGWEATNSPKGTIAFSTLAKWCGGDRPHILDIIDAGRNTLRIIVEGLYPGNYLKHAPVRTYFRIISIAIILLKTFVLGATEDDVTTTFNLMDKAIQALRTCIVDDVHVGNCFANLLETLTNRIRSRFVRMAPSGNGSNHISRGVSPAPQRAGQLPGQATMPAMMSGGGAGQTQTLPPLEVVAGEHPTQQPRYGWPNFSLNGLNTESNGTTSQPYTPVNIMPPPSFVMNNGHFGPGSGNGNGNGSGNYQSLGGGANEGGFTGFDGGDDMAQNGFDQDWLALPLDPLLNSYGADVTQAGYGPDVGGYDLLEVLLSGMEGGAGGA